jgi:hypothetical protein
MFLKRKPKLDEMSITNTTDTPAKPPEPKPPERYDVLCEATPYVLLNIIATDKYGEIISYFQFIYIDPYIGLRICDTRYPLNEVHMDLSDDVKPYVEKTHPGIALHIPRNSVVQRVIISNSVGNSNQSDNSNNILLPILAGTAGLATGIAIGNM